MSSHRNKLNYMFKNNQKDNNSQSVKKDMVLWKIIWKYSYTIHY